MSDENGIATFNWIPTENISGIHFAGYGDFENGHQMKDGSVRFFGDDDVRYDSNAEKNNWWNYEECKNGKCYLVKEGETPKWIYETDADGIVTLTLPDLARVQGTVKYSDGTPVAYVYVSRNSHDQCGHGLRKTNENGEFFLSENADTKLNLAVESEKECAPAIFAYEVGDGSNVKKLSIVLKKGVTLKGTIYDADGKPLKGVFGVYIYEKNPDEKFPDDISIRQTSNFLTPETQSVYQYVLPSGKFKINASFQDQSSESHELEIKPEQTEDIVLDLRLKKK